MHRLQPFESWDVSVPTFPPRSRLYNLEPIGIGTALVEGLTGYVSRLAAAHSVSVGDLVGRELAENGLGLPLVYPTKRLEHQRRLSHCFSGASYSLNGKGASTHSWIDVLQTKTCRTELRMLTLLPFEEVLPKVGLFRKRRAWCPEWVRSWRKKGDPLYEPLLWSLRVATVCPLHRRPLQESCPLCNHRSRPLAILTRPGYCSRCQRSLEVRGGNSVCNYDGNVSHALRVATALGGLLEAAPCLPKGVNRTVFRENLQWLVEGFAGGNVTAFAQGLSMSFFVLDSWRKGEYLPCLDGLLELSEKLNTKLVNLILPGGVIGNVDVSRIERMMREGSGNRKSFPNAAEIRRELQAAAKEVPPPLLTGIARRLGFKYVASLRRVDSDLCKRISKNYRKSTNAYWWRRRGAKAICPVEKMKKVLEIALTADNPPSTKHLCRRLGYADDQLMRKRFPDLCTGISAKRRKWKASLPARIRPSFEKALLEEPPPSLFEIARRNGIGTIKTLKKYCPLLERELAARQATFRNARDTNRRAALEQALTENPVPSLSVVAKRLGLSKAVVRVQFYDLCAALGERYRMAFKNCNLRKGRHLPTKNH